MKNLFTFILQMDANHMMHGWNSWLGMGLIFVFWLLVLVLVATLIWFLIRKGSASSGRALGDSSLEILRNRYARGEIGEEEYLRIKKELTD